MKLRILPQGFAVCKLKSVQDADLFAPYTFLAVTDDEISLVCGADRVPEGATDVEPGWRCMKIEGPLAFSMVGVIARISAILAEKRISLFVVSTFDTDYVLVKADSLEAQGKIIYFGSRRDKAKSLS